MLSSTVLLVITLAAGFYMAWNIGANDVANAMGTPVGSGALTLKRAIILAGIFEFAGAFFVGSSVADTIKDGIVPWQEFSEANLFALGMLASLLASAIWLNIATFFGQPVSTTHAIIGAIIGFAVLSNGLGCVRWSQMGSIAASWIISPIAGGLLAFLTYWSIRRFVLESRHTIFMARRAVPIATGAVVAILALSVIYKGLPRLKLDLTLLQALPSALLAGLAAGGGMWFNIQRRANSNYVPFRERYTVVERWFSRLQVLTGCYMAFAHGANDVANAIGPLAGAISVFRDGGSLASKTVIPTWLLAFGGLGIVLGLATYGFKVIEAVGRKITEITPTRGFSAEFGTATTVLVCSKLGLPISTTFVLVGAVMGVGLARGFGALDLGVIKRIFLSWLVTIPISAVLSAFIFQMLRMLAGY